MKDAILNGILFFLSVLPDIPFKMLNFAFVKELCFRFSATCFRLTVRWVAVRFLSTVHASCEQFRYRAYPIACRVPFAGIGRRFSEVSVKVYKDYFQVL